MFVPFLLLEPYMTYYYVMIWYKYFGTEVYKSNGNKVARKALEPALNLGQHWWAQAAGGKLAQH